MSDQHRSDWLTVEAAAARLGVSPATVKRRINDGKPVRVAGDRSVEIEAEQVARPQGHEWQVRIRTALPPIKAAQERSDSESAAPINSAQDDSGALTALREAWAEDRAVLGTLRTENADLRERAGRAETRADLAERRVRELEAERDRLTARLERPWWRFW